MTEKDETFSAKAEKFIDESQKKGKDFLESHVEKSGERLNNVAEKTKKLFSPGKD